MEEIHNTGHDEYAMKASGFVGQLQLPPHTQRERGKVNGVGVHIYNYMYIYICGPKQFESYFSDQLTFLNI